MVFESQIGTFLTELKRAAQSLEEGKSREPLSKRVAELQRMLSSHVLQVTVVALGQHTGADFLKLLVPNCPQGFSTRSLDINDGQNFVKEASKSHQFDSADKVFDHITALPADTLSKPCEKLSLDGMTDIAPARIQFAGLERLLEFDLLEFNRLINRTDLVIVTAPMNYIMTEHERVGLWQILSNKEYISVVALPKKGEESEGTLWHQEPVPAHLKGLAPLRMTASALPDYFVNADSSERKHLIHHGLLVQSKQAQLLISEQLAEKLHYLQCCEEADDFTLSLIENDPELTKDLDLNRAALDTLNESLDRFSKQLQEDSKAALVGKGPFYHMVDGELDRIGADDIEKEEVHNVYKLTISSNVLDEIAKGLIRKVNKRAEEDSHKVNDKFEQIVNQVKQQLKAWPEGLNISTREPLGKQGDNSKEDYLDFKIRYRGEMPKRGFLKRVGEGRKAMFMVLMMFSIFGGMLGFNYRNYAFMSVFFVLLFLGGTVFTFFSWRKDDAFKMEKEVDKAKDQLHSEYLRAVTEIERNRVKRLSDEITQFTRQQRQAFEQWQRKSTDEIKTKMLDAKDKDKQKKSMLKAEMVRFGRLQVDLSQLAQKENEYQSMLAETDVKLGLG